MISFSIRNFFFCTVTVSVALATGSARICLAGVRSPAQEYADRIASSELAGAAISVLALTPQGDTIVSLVPDRLLIPASNMKIVTTGLALEQFGEDYTFKTSIGYSGTVADSTLTGDLYIIGGGDPTLASGDSIAAPLEELFGCWADMLSEAGIRVIDGDIIGDDRWFDISMHENPTWQLDDSGTYYGAGVCGLSFNRNMQSFAVTPGEQPGDSVKVEETFPVCPWMKYSFKCLTGEAGTGDRLYYYTTDLAPAGQMRGTFAAGKPGKVLDCSNKFPAYTCAHYFREWLEDNGIRCSGKAADTGLFAPEGGIVPSDSLEIIGSTSSASLARIAFETNHESDNVYAETLFHALGKAIYGSAGHENSRLAARTLLEKAGAAPTRVRIQDGSGLSRHNLLSPSFLCTFLEKMEDSKSSGSFVRSLPSPGSHGTMESVMPEYGSGIKNRIRLKSGSMSGVKCFSGYIFPTEEAARAAEAGIWTLPEEDRPTVFSVMINNSLLSQYRLQKMTDRLICLISAGLLE